MGNTAPTSWTGLGSCENKMNTPEMNCSTMIGSQTIALPFSERMSPLIPMPSRLQAVQPSSSTQREGEPAPGEVGSFSPITVTPTSSITATWASVAASTEADLAQEVRARPASAWSAAA